MYQCTHRFHFSTFFVRSGTVTIRSVRHTSVVVIVFSPNGEMITVAVAETGDTGVHGPRLILQAQHHWFVGIAAPDADEQDDDECDQKRKYQAR